MENDPKPDTSKVMKQKDDIQRKKQFCPIKCFSEIVYLETESQLKTAEVKARLKLCDFLKTTREEIVRNHPTANLVHLHELEEYQIGETSKRLGEVKSINKEIREIDERVQKIWPKK